MQRLYEITVPGLSMRTDLPAIRRRLLAVFPRVVEVLAMTTPATVLVVYRGEDEIDAWCEELDDAVTARRERCTRRTRLRGQQSRSQIAPSRSATGNVFSLRAPAAAACCRSDHEPVAAYSIRRSCFAWSRMPTTR
jgi:hypothetical protein